MAMEMSGVVGGQSIISLTLRKNREGVRVSVQAIPEVEDLFKAWSSGVTHRASEYGRHWINRDQIPTVYSMGTGVSSGVFDGGAYFLDFPGYPLVLTERVAISSGPGLMVVPSPVPINMQANISFLRMVGLSEGVHFSIEQVYSPEEFSRVHGLLMKAINRFIRDYLVDVTITGTILGSPQRGLL